MEREIKLMRIFSLGQYQNLQVTSTLSNVPAELALDQNFVDKISKLMLIEIETNMNDYCMLREATRKGQSFEEVAVILEDQRVSETEELFKNTNFNQYIEKLMKTKGE